VDGRSCGFSFEDDGRARAEGSFETIAAGFRVLAMLMQSFVSRARSNVYARLKWVIVSKNSEV
jgi:hypothetical protein